MPSLLPALAAIPPDVVSASDYERRAPDHLAPKTWAYLAGGAGDEITLAENTSAFAALKLKPRTLVPVTGGHTRVSLLGETLPHPFLLAPVGWHKLFHPQGELAVAQAARVMETVFAVSSLATTPLETLAATTAPLWFQLYIQPSRAATEQMVRRAEAAGCQALIVTVDAPLGGIRNREQRAGFALPPGLKAENLVEDPVPVPSLTPGASPVFDHAMLHAPVWNDIAGLVRLSTLPVFVKGILSPEDAARALEAGAAGIVVSNHGGRVLDTVPAAINALPAIAARVGGTAPILFDSGIRRGSDAFKAIALGASAVFVGRPYIHALSVAGALGVAHLVRTLREELEITMALAGCPTLDEASPDFLWNPPSAPS